MLRKLFLAFTVLVGFAVAVPEIRFVHTLVGVSEAQAQQIKRKRKTLFDVLFKRRKKKNNRATTTVNRQNLRDLPGVGSRNKKRVRASGTNKKRSTAATKPKVIAVKSENAAKILVVGDFMASGIASGLERLYADNPNIVIVNKGNASSGIVRDDVIDWPNSVGAMIDDYKPIAVINLVGMNDRQQMRLKTGRVEKLSDEWLAQYNKRVEKLASIGREKSVPLVWVGLPPVRSGRMNADYLVFNEIYRGKAEAAGASFVDVWDGFTNAEGKYVSAGPDINGQIVRLRGSKGITMLRAGKQKLAFFVDKTLKRLGVLGDGEGAQFASLGTINLKNAQPQVPDYDPVGTGRTVVIPLGSPASDGGNVLEGDYSKEKPDERIKSASYSLVEQGLVDRPQEGRVDANWGIPAPEKAKPEPENADAPKDDKTTTQSSGITASELPKVTNIGANNTQSGQAEAN
ncbi:MAG: SGNH family hydrolase [Rhizobiaceae bacterium]|nr:SGNH family hydrolase [Rhizobiaceae bacterium]